MYCMNCGQKNPDGAKFCCQCGTPLGTVSKGKGGKKRIWPVLLIALIVAFIISTLSDAPEEKPTETQPAKPIVQTESDFEERTTATPVTEAPGADIPYLEGAWESVHLSNGNSNLNVSALVYDQTVYRCTEMTIMMEVEMNAGTSCKDWDVWGRNGGSFTKIGKIYLPNGNGETTQTLRFSTPVTFDAIAITPTVPGGYSWSMGFVLMDIWTK